VEGAATAKGEDAQPAQALMCGGGVSTRCTDDL